MAQIHLLQPLNILLQNLVIAFPEGFELFRRHLLKTCRQLFCLSDKERQSLTVKTVGIGPHLFCRRDDDLHLFLTFYIVFRLFLIIRALVPVFTAVFLPYSMATDGHPFRQAVQWVQLFPQTGRPFFIWMLLSGQTRTHFPQLIQLSVAWKGAF